MPSPSTPRHLTPAFRERSRPSRNRSNLLRTTIETLEDRVTPTTFVVTSTGDTNANFSITGGNLDLGGMGSGTSGDLRYCLSQANLTPGPDDIVFNVPVNSTIALNRVLIVDDDVMIHGETAFNLTVSGQNANRVFFITQGSVGIANLTIANGLAKGGNGNSGGGGGAGLGGGLLIDGTLGATTVTLSNVTFTGNRAIGGNGASTGTLGGGGGGAGGNAGVANAGVTGGGGFLGASGAGAFAVSSGGGGFTGTSGGGVAGTAGGSIGGGGSSGGGVGSTGGGNGGASNGAGGGGSRGFTGSSPGNPGVGNVGGAGGYGGGGGAGSGGGDGGSGGDYGGGGGSGGGGKAGAGGFGGGGGESYSNVGGKGGFGGGGGGGATPGLGGDFGGNAGGTNGGGGAGLGGALFLRAGTLYLIGTTFTGNTATGGASGGGTATVGTSSGGAIFIKVGATAKALGAAPSFSGNNAASNGDVGGILITDVEATLRATTDTPQQTPITTVFPSPLNLTLTDGSNNLVPNALITFTGPDSGAHASFSGKFSANTAVTNASGEASTTATANGTTGTYTVTATAGTLSATFDFTNAPLGETSAAVQSINRDVPIGEVTHEASVTYLVTFNEVVSGVTAGNFGLSGTAGVGTIGTPTTADGGLTWSVTVTGLTGANGSLQLNLVNNTGIFDLASNPLSTTAFSGQAYTLYSPVSTIEISPPSFGISTGNSVTYTITYKDDYFSAITLSASNVVLNKTGTASGTVSVSPGSGSTRIVTIDNISGDGTLGISLAAGTANDRLGNPAPAVGPSATFIVATSTPPIELSSTSVAFAVGGSDGTVRLLNNVGTLLSTVTPFVGYTGLVSVALGNFNADAVPDLAVAAANPAGVAGLPTSVAGLVRVYDGAALAKGTLTIIHTFTPFANHAGPDGTGGAFTNGLNIAAGDVNGDGHADLIAGTRGGNGTVGKNEYGRLVVIDGTSPAGSNNVIGGIQTPFGAGYQKGVVVAAGNIDGVGGDEIAVTRGGPVNSPNPAVQQIKVKVLQLQGTALTELHLAADGSTAFAPFAELTGAAKGINRDGRVAFVDSDGDGKDELVFSALDPLSNSANAQVRVGVYSIDPTASKGAVTVVSTGPDAGTYLTGAVVKDHAITRIAAVGSQQNLALITESELSGVVYLAPRTGVVQVGGFSLSIVTGGINIDGI